ncbi:MAG: phage major capsid protein [Vicinamibacteria bacterium]|nr:phage major capsid protein [Vicinamibacteria bacterium]
MSTAPALTFKDAAEAEAFTKRLITEEVSPLLEKALKPLTEKQANVMREMLDASERERDKKNAMPKGHRFARMARAMALGRLETGQTDPEAATHAVKKRWGADDVVIKDLADAAKLKAVAAQAGDPTSLGNLVAPVWSTEFIELLRNRPTIRSIARVIPNPTGSLTMRRQTAAGVAYWVGEGINITPSKPGVGLMNFLRKKLAALCILSNDLIRYAGPEADRLVLEDLLKASALAEDLAFLRGDGTEYAPKGIRSLVEQFNSSAIYAQTGTTLATVDADFSKALRLIEEANIDLEGGDEVHWVMVPRVKWALWNLAPATDTGARPYRDGINMSPARVLGYRAHVTNQIPKNLGGGGNETETYALHGPSLMIADTLNVLTEVFPGGAYHDGSAVVSGISTDETVIRLLRETDFNMRHIAAASVIKSQTLGA